MVMKVSVPPDPAAVVLWDGEQLFIRIKPTRNVE
jgi:hypothetical protein